MTEPALRRSRAGWIAFGLLLAAWAALVLATMRTGVGGDPRIANPHPGPEPYSISPLLDPVPNTIMSLGGVVGMALLLAWLSRRAGRLHWVAIIAIGSLFTGLVDPLANWATFASLNPAVPHVPTNWPVVRLAPLSEPVSAFLGGYTTYYLSIGLAMYWLARRFVVGRSRPGSWLARHQLATVFVTAWIVSFPINALFQLAWMGAGMLVYTQFLGPVIQVGHLQLPVLILFYDPFVYGTVAVLACRNEQGDSIVLSRLATLLPGRGGRERSTPVRQIVVAAVLMMASILGPIAAFALIRASGTAEHVVYERWPFSETSVYDPYGDVERAGKPGPFHR